MATDVASSPAAERPSKRRPFASFVKRLTNFKNSDQKRDENGKKANGGGGLRHRKNNTLPGKNNPYPQSGHLHEAHQASHPSFGTSAREQDGSASFASLPDSSLPGRDGHNSHSNKSGAPTLATNAETVHSEAGNSRAVTTSTAAGALSTVGANSTFSSPNHSDHSLTTTLTTIQSTSNATGAGGQTHAPSDYMHYNSQSQPNGSDFSHQYPVSPGPSAAVTASAIPRHLHTDSTSTAIANTPATYSSATANNMLSDNASILTLASSSKRRRRSMDTDASVRALAPGSTFGGSRESLPLSVLSGGQETSRQSIGGIPGTASAERASVYSSSGLVRELPAAHTSALQSERNSYYNRPGDAKSLRSITNIKDDARSISGMDARSISGMDARSQYDAKSMHDVASLRSVDARSGLQMERGDSGHHARNGSIPGSIGGPTYTPSLLRQTSAAGTLNLSRRSSNWDEGGEQSKGNNELEVKTQQD